MLQHQSPNLGGELPPSPPGLAGVGANNPTSLVRAAEEVVGVMTQPQSRMASAPVPLQPRRPQAEWVFSPPRPASAPTHPPAPVPTSPTRPPAPHLNLSSLKAEVLRTAMSTRNGVTHAQDAGFVEDGVVLPPLYRPEWEAARLRRIDSITE